MNMRRRMLVIVAAATVGGLLGLGAVALAGGGDGDGGGEPGDATDTGGTAALGNADAPDGGGGEGDGWHGALLTEAEPRPSFTLTDTNGEPYDFATETAGDLTLLFFGYTNCPDICPIHMATLSQALEQPGVPQPTVVFVTTDPARDTPARLREWLDGFGTDFVGLTGTRAEIVAAEQAAGVAGSFAATPDGSPSPTTGEGNYEVGHAAQIIAYTPDDLAHIVYPYGVQRDDWAADLPRLADGFEPRP